MRPNMRPINGYKAKLLSRIKNINPALAADLHDIKLPWYHMRNVANEDESVGAEIFIYDEIGGTLGIDASEFVADLQAIKDKKITVRINSPGGDVFDALAIYNALVQHPADITTRVDALAASAASIIAMSGDTLEMMVGSQLMIHDAMTATIGNPAELREMAKFLDAQSDNIASVYAERGGTGQDWRALMRAETWMFADEAVGFGLADSVYTRKVRQAVEEEEVEIDPDSMPEEEESSEDEEDEEAATEEEIDALIENLMSAQHRLTNRGWKHAGRKAAPAPTARGGNLSRAASAYLERLTNG